MECLHWSGPPGNGGLVGQLPLALALIIVSLWSLSNFAAGVQPGTVHQTKRRQAAGAERVGFCYHSA